MTVHASSVISPWLNSYNSTAYTSITTLENAAYTTDTVTKWQGMFNELDWKMTVYKGTSRSALFYDFMNALYSNYILHYMYGTDGSALASGDGYTLFSMNGFLTAIQGRATSYYNDWTTATGSGASFTATISGGAVTSVTGTGGTLYVPGGVKLGIKGGGGSGAYAAASVSGGVITPNVVVGGSGYTSAPTVTVCVGTSVKLAADTSNVDTSVTSETATMSSLEGTYRSVISPLTTRLLFEDVVPSTTFKKSDLVTAFFTNMHYKAVYQNLNLSPLTLPPGA